MLAATAEHEHRIAAVLLDYWEQSRRPLISLVFILPLLIAYEAGVLLLGPQAARNGADVWLRQLLDGLGFAERLQYFMLPVITIGLLLGWHHLTHRPWTISRGVLFWMFVECGALAILLIGLAHLQGTLLQQLGWQIPRATVESAMQASVTDGSKTLLGRIVGYFGAGIYEEVLFRLVLLATLWAMFRGWFGESKGPAILAVIFSSAIFSAAHYIGPHGEPFAIYTFLFRFVAGSFFAVLFVLRGFGVAAGTHAGYDILVGLMY